MIITKTAELKDKMTRQGFSGQGFAKATGISQSYIVQILSGKRTVLAPTAKRICDTLKCDFDDVFVIKVGE